MGGNTKNTWHVQDAEETLRILGTSFQEGLTQAEASDRLKRIGPNELVRGRRKSSFRILYEQFANLLVIILLVAAGVSLALGDTKDAGAILAIVVLNAFLGFRQEYGAEKSLAALRKLSVPRARVRRGGSVREIDARELVPGDIVFLEAGNLVPADGRLLHCASLRIQEAALTGESMGVEKTDEPVHREDAPIADRRNRVYMGTIVTYGHGDAVITETGMRTELGRVAGLLKATEDEPTPLTVKIKHLGKVLVGIALGLILIVALTGFLRGGDWRLVFLTAVSMAVAAVPEGLPAVVTIALALGARRMFARRALIRKLPAVETLGAVTGICTDKTGTLTQNQMTVVILSLPGEEIMVPPPSRGSPDYLEEIGDDALLCLAAGALCSDAVFETGASKAQGDDDRAVQENTEYAVRGDNEHAAPEDDDQAAREDGEPVMREDQAIGDPTEVALVVAAARAGLPQPEITRYLARIAEVPFDSVRKRMSTVHAVPDSLGEMPHGLRRLIQAFLGESATPAVIFTKGAVGNVLKVSKRIRISGHVSPLTEEWRHRLIERTDRLAADGIRVLAIAYRPTQAVAGAHSSSDLERDLILIGFVGLSDPLREEVRSAVRTCISAGIRPIMITGDHPLMAQRIGRELGIDDRDRILTGSDIEAMSDAELKGAVAGASIFARVSPEHKLRIVDALQARGEIVAMTGDGVNDAPALKSADIGVAMGRTGTDVAKEASDMVLLDDRYMTIVAAVREGRVIFDNIRRFVRYILSSNSGELLVMLMAPLFGMPLPLLPVQILWMNLVTDGLPALALGVEKPESDVMRRPPRNPRAPIIDRRMASHVIWVGLLMATLSLAVGYNVWKGNWLPSTAPVALEVTTESLSRAGHEVVRAMPWQTMLFTTMVFSQLFLALAVRSTRDSLFSIGLFSNRPLLGALLLTSLLQFAVVYTPFLQGFFKTVPLGGRQIGICLLASAAIFIAVELEKAILRRRA